MKIFNRGSETKTPAAPTAPAGPAAATAPALPTPRIAAAPAPAAPAPSAPEPAAPDLTAILDANVKEMSEKIARLATSLESAQQDRTGFEAKIEQMEDRMRKLSSLTEMISAQYNPFVGDAPTEREPMPRPEVGLAAPPLPPSMALPPPAEAPPAGPALTLGLPPEPAPHAPPGPHMAAIEPPAMAFPPVAAPPSLAPADAGGVYLWNVASGFESSMLLLGWADMLLTSAGSRESLLDLVNYYHNIGWLGDPARDQLLAYADGLLPPESTARPDWRADVNTHEKSLLFVEKLRAIGERRSG